MCLVGLQYLWQPNNNDVFYIHQNKNYLNTFGWWTHSNVETSRASIRKARVSNRPRSTTLIATLSKAYGTQKNDTWHFILNELTTVLFTSCQLMYSQFYTWKVAASNISAKSIKTNSPAQSNLKIQHTISIEWLLFEWDMFIYSKLANKSKLNRLESNHIE